MNQRAKSAADFLNSGDQWRCNNVAGDYPSASGRWFVYRKPHVATVNVEGHYRTNLQLIALAEAEGWVVL